MRAANFCDFAASPIMIGTIGCTPGLIDKPSLGQCSAEKLCVLFKLVAQFSRCTEKFECF